MSKALLLASLLIALPAQAQQTEEITYLLPAPAFLPAFAPWRLAQQRGYFAQEEGIVRQETPLKDLYTYEFVQ